MAVNVKFVPNKYKCNNLPDDKRFYQYTCINQASRKRFIYYYDSHTPKNFKQIIKLNSLGIKER